MAKNYNGVQINQSVTIAGEAGAAITDARNKIVAFDTNGKVVLATAGTTLPLGITLIEAGYNDITGAESGKVAVGDDVTVQIKDIGVVIAGETIKKGQEITAGAGGVAAVADDGEYVLGIALGDAAEGSYFPIQIAKYQKAAAVATV